MQFRSIWSSVKVSFSAQPAAGQLRLSHNKKGQNPTARPTLGRSKFILGVATSSAPSVQLAFSSDTQSRKRPQVGRIWITCRYNQAIFKTTGFCAANFPPFDIFAEHKMRHPISKPTAGRSKFKTRVAPNNASVGTQLYRATRNIENDRRKVEISNTCRYIQLMSRTSLSAQPAAQQFRFSHIVVICTQPFA